MILSNYNGTILYSLRTSDSLSFFFEKLDVLFVSWVDSVFTEYLDVRFERRTLNLRIHT